jgi:hypothetical protein
MHQVLASIGARKRLAITLIAALAATLFAIQDRHRRQPSTTPSTTPSTMHTRPAAKARPPASAS